MRDLLTLFLVACAASILYAILAAPQKVKGANPLPILWEITGKFIGKVRSSLNWRSIILILIVGEIIHLAGRYGALPNFFGAGEPIPTPTETGEWFWRNWILILAGFGGLMFFIHEFIGVPSLDKAKADQNQARSKRLERSLMVLTVGGFLLYFVGPYLPNGQVRHGVKVQEVSRLCSEFTTRTQTCLVDPTQIRVRYAALPITREPMQICVSYGLGNNGATFHSGNAVGFKVSGTQAEVFRYRLFPQGTACPSL